MTTAKAPQPEYVAVRNSEARRYVLSYFFDESKDLQPGVIMREKGIKTIIALPGMNFFKKDEFEKAVPERLLEDGRVQGYDGLEVVDVAAMPISQAKATLEVTKSKGYLEIWRELDKRKAVRDAIEERLK
jgi:hypothetical protein